MNFVTGGSGFLGAHLICQLLQQGSPVVALRRQKSDMRAFQTISGLYFPDAGFPHDQLQWVQGDLLEPGTFEDSLHEGDDVYHCAAEVGFEKGMEKQLRNANVNGTLGLVNLCLEKKIHRFCHVSSIGCLGSRSDGMAVAETDHWLDNNPHSAYSKSKYLAELEVWRGMAEGLNAVIVNPSVITGPGGKNSSFGKIIEQVAHGLKYFPPGANAWVDVRDVARAMILLLKEPESTGQYIISSENLSYREVLTMVAEGLNTAAPAKPASKKLLQYAGTALRFRQGLTGKPNPITSDFVRIVCNHFSCTSAKLIALKSFRFIPLKESIMAACEIHQQA